MANHDDLPYIVVERRSGSISAFFWGALLGAGAALLLAPRSGAETRRELKDGVRKLRDNAEDTVRQARESLASTVDEFRGQVVDRVDSARRAVEAGREAARRTRVDLEERVRSARAGWEAARAEEEAESVELGPEDEELPD